MGGELAGPAATVTSNFMPAVHELFSSKGAGGSIDDLMAAMGKVWQAAKNAIASLGGKIANMICDFFVKDSAEEELGDTVGYLVGMIAFQALLEYLSAGTWDGVMAVLQAIAKFLNWPMEFLGEAMGLLKKLGGFLLDGIKDLGAMAAEGAGGALREVMGALGDIGTKLGEFAEEILGKFGREAEAEAGAVESQAAHAAESDAARAAENDAARAAENDAAAAEERELSAAEKEAQKAEELVEAEAVIQGIKRGAAAGHVPGPALVLALDGLKSRYAWIEGFGPVGQPAPFELMMYASEHDEGRYDPGTVPGELPEPKPEGKPKPTEGGEPPVTEPTTLPQELDDASGLAPKATDPNAPIQAGESVPYKESTVADRGVKGDKLTGDHIPSRASLVEAEQEARYAAEEARLGRPLTDAERAQLKLTKAEEDRIRDEAMVLVKDEGFHVGTSRTWGPRNNAAQISQDAADLAAAVEADFATDLAEIERSGALTRARVAGYIQHYQNLVSEGVIPYTEDINQLLLDYLRKAA